MWYDLTIPAAKRVPVIYFSPCATRKLGTGIDGTYDGASMFPYVKLGARGDAQGGCQGGDARSVEDDGVSDV